MLDDAQLLARYVKENSQDAFAELVSRHLNFVYSAALRQVQTRPLAEDVAQLVFVNLARKASSLPNRVVLKGWLHRDTRFTALDALRSESRRRAREQHALSMNAPSENDPNWEQIRPWLDEALDQMSPAERDALLLRFFEQLSFKEVGEALRSGEDAARKRVDRALDKLRALLLQRGVTTSASALALALAAKGVEIAPGGLAAKISVASAAVGATAVTAIKIISMSQLKNTLAALIAAAAITTAVLQHRAIEKLRAENGDLLAQSQKLAEFQADNDRLSKLLAQAQRPQLSQEQMSELMRLRGQVGLLRDNLRKAQATNQTPSSVKTEAPTEPAQPFTAKFTAQIADKQTLLTGGWKTSPGKRTFVLMTPNIDPVAGSTTQTATDGSTFEMPNASVTVDSHIFEIPETMLEQFGLDQFKTDGQDSSVQTILAAGDAEALLKSLATNDAVIISNPRITANDGIQSTVSVSASDNAPAGAPVFSIGVTPNLTADKTAVNMAINAQVTSLAPKN